MPTTTSRADIEHIALGRSERAVLSHIMSLPRQAPVTSRDVGDALYTLVSSWANYRYCSASPPTRRRWAAKLLYNLVKKGVLHRSRLEAKDGQYGYWVDDADRPAIGERLALYAPAKSE